MVSTSEVRKNWLSTLYARIFFLILSSTFLEVLTKRQNSTRAMEENLLKFVTKMTGCGAPKSRERSWLLELLQTAGASQFTRFNKSMSTLSIAINTFLGKT